MSDSPPAPRWERFYPTLTLGARVLAFDEVDSTMDVAWALADADYRHGTAVRASAQRTGRGRFSRRWISGRDESLLLSVILRSPPLAVDAPIAVAATLAVADTVASVTGKDCGIKWPNDVQVGGKKIAGILVESRVMSRGQATSVLGIGLNVNLDPSNDPQLQEIATSIANVLGEAADLEEMEAALLANLDDQVDAMRDNTPSVIERWRDRLTTIGQEVTVHSRDRVLTGVAVDVDHNGHLLLRTSDRMIHRLAEGDVTLRG